jgi:hypothetical protein
VFLADGRRQLLGPSLLMLQQCSRWLVYTVPCFVSRDLETLEALLNISDLATAYWLEDRGVVIPVPVDSWEPPTGYPNRYPGNNSITG